MSAFEVRSWEISRQHGHQLLTVPLQLPQGERLWTLQLPEAVGPLDESGIADGLTAMLLLSAMWQGIPLKIPTPVSAEILTNQRELQEIAVQWFAGLQRVDILAEARPSETSPPRTGRATSAAFTAGVDSMLTATRNRDEIDFFVYIQGYGPVQELLEDRFAPVAQHLRKVAEKLGIPLHLGRTNHREHEDVCVPWMDNHGSALAALGLFMGNSVERFLIPSSDPWSNQRPWGSHHLLEERWGTQRVHVEIDGLRWDRPWKVQQLLADFPEFVPDLAVCWGNLAQPVVVRNCGICEKCLRTMCALAICGWEHWEQAFQAPLDLDRVRQMKLEPPALEVSWEPLHAFASAKAPDHPVAQAVADVVANGKLRLFLQKLQAAESDWRDIPGLSRLALWWRDEVWQSWSVRQTGWLRKKIKSLAAQQPTHIAKALWGKDPL